MTRRRGLASLYDVTLLDWNPILDRTDEPGYYVAMGTSGSSYKTAPPIGLLMAELIGQVSDAVSFVLTVDSLRDSRLSQARVRH